MEGEGLHQDSPPEIRKDSARLTGGALRSQQGDQFFRCFVCLFWTPRKDSTQAATYESQRRNTGGYGGIYPAQRRRQGVGPLRVPTLHEGGGVGTPEGHYPEVELDLESGIMDPMPWPS